MRVSSCAFLLVQSREIVGFEHTLFKGTLQGAIKGLSSILVRISAYHAG